MRMELTVCGTSRGHLVVADACLVEIERPGGSLTLSKALAVIVGGAAGGAIGAALLAADDDEDGGLRGSLLNLDQGESLPEDIESLDRVATCWGSEAPSQLVQHRSWPRRLGEDATLTFFPHKLIRHVRLAGNGALFANVDGPKNLDVRIRFWQVGKARLHLLRAQYPLR